MLPTTASLRSTTPATVANTTRSTLVSFLFPIFASYKALRTSDPALLTPWLMYWVVLSLLLTVESTFYFILGWIPFYAWFRLMLHCYLVLPGFQGAQTLYQTHVHPFLLEHENELDTFISEAHDRAKALGLLYAKQAVEWVKVMYAGGARNFIFQNVRQLSRVMFCQAEL